MTVGPHFPSFRKRVRSRCNLYPLHSNLLMTRLGPSTNNIFHSYPDVRTDYQWCSKRPTLDFRQCYFKLQLRRMWCAECWKLPMQALALRLAHIRSRVALSDSPIMAETLWGREQYGGSPLHRNIISVSTSQHGGWPTKHHHLSIREYWRASMSERAHGTGYAFCIGLIDEKSGSELGNPGKLTCIKGLFPWYSCTIMVDFSLQPRPPVTPLPLA